MKGCSFLQSKRGLLALFIGFWICFVFIQQRVSTHERELYNHSGDEDTLDNEATDTQSSLIGEDPSEILVKNIEKLDEVESDDVKDCKESTLRDRPFIIRGRVRDWPAMKKWNFQWVADIKKTVDVLVSPSFSFKYYNEKKAEEIVSVKGPTGLPSTFAEMPSHEAIQRMFAKRQEDFEPLFYHKDGNGRERYYLRFDIEDSKILNDVNLNDGYFRCNKEYPRLWVSIKGSVSPMHWDGSYSCLAQIHGTKRMLFYTPDDVDKLGTYPKSHMFWRRSMFDPTNPDYERFPHASFMTGYMGVLHPGDLVCFPPKWLHYTDTLSHSISMTVRFDPK